MTHGEKKSLAGLRRQIDDIDDQIHDLLMQRTLVAGKIGAQKGRGNGIMRPGREATVLRRLIARHRGRLPRALIVHIWREIFSANIALQGTLSVAVCAPEGTFGYRNLARDHFGWRTPMIAFRSAAQVLEAVSDGKASVGVLPVPHGEEIVDAVKSIAQAVTENKLNVEDISEETISQALYTKNLPDPDLLIRTGGEHRISNFLLWNLAYAELWFCDVFWPDFRQREFDQALDFYAQRQRRRGYTGDQLEAVKC